MLRVLYVPSLGMLRLNLTAVGSTLDPERTSVSHQSEWLVDTTVCTPCARITYTPAFEVVCLFVSLPVSTHVCFFC